MVISNSNTGSAPLKKPRPESAGNRNAAGLGTTRASKRLTRLPMILEMDIMESPLLKILGKKFKTGGTTINTG